MDIKIYRTDGWTRIEVNGELFDEDHNEGLLFENLLKELGHSVNKEWIDEDDWMW